MQPIGSDAQVEQVDDELANLRQRDRSRIAVVHAGQRLDRGDGQQMHLSTLSRVGPATGTSVTHRRLTLLVTGTT